MGVHSMRAARMDPRRRQDGAPVQPSGRLDALQVAGVQATVSSRGGRYDRLQKHRENIRRCAQELGLDLSQAKPSAKESQHHVKRERQADVEERQEPYREDIRSLEAEFAQHRAGGPTIAPANAAVTAAEIRSELGIAGDEVPPLWQGPDFVESISEAANAAFSTRGSGASAAAVQDLQDVLNTGEPVEEALLRPTLQGPEETPSTQVSLTFQGILDRWKQQHEAFEQVVSGAAPPHSALFPPPPQHYMPEKQHASQDSLGGDDAEACLRKLRHELGLDSLFDVASAVPVEPLHAEPFSFQLPAPATFSMSSSMRPSSRPAWEPVGSAAIASTPWQPAQALSPDRVQGLPSLWSHSEALHGKVDTGTFAAQSGGDPLLTQQAQRASHATSSLLCSSWLSSTAGDDQMVPSGLPERPAHSANFTFDVAPASAKGSWQHEMLADTMPELPRSAPRPILQSRSKQTQATQTESPATPVRLSPVSGPLPVPVLQGEAPGSQPDCFQGAAPDKQENGTAVGEAGEDEELQGQKAAGAESHVASDDRSKKHNMADEWAGPSSTQPPKEATQYATTSKLRQQPLPRQWTDTAPTGEKQTPTSPPQAPASPTTRWPSRQMLQEAEVQTLPQVLASPSAATWRLSRQLREVDAVSPQQAPATPPVQRPKSPLIRPPRASSPQLMAQCPPFHASGQSDSSQSAQQQQQQQQRHTAGAPCSSTPLMPPTQEHPQIPYGFATPSSAVSATAWDLGLAMPLREPCGVPVWPGPMMDAACPRMQQWPVRRPIASDVVGLERHRIPQHVAPTHVDANAALLRTYEVYRKQQLDLRQPIS